MVRIYQYTCPCTSKEYIQAHYYKRGSLINSSSVVDNTPTMLKLLLNGAKSYELTLVSRKNGLTPVTMEYV